MMKYNDPKSVGNSSKYHTGKPCVEDCCERPAGTYWSPFWCFEHNVERMDRISASLDDMTKRAEMEALVNKQTAELRRWAYEMSKTIKAMVLASGGKVTIKNADKDRALKSESVHYGKDTTTYEYWA